MAQHHLGNDFDCSGFMTAAQCVIRIVRISESSDMGDIVTETGDVLCSFVCCQCDSYGYCHTFTIVVS